MTRQYVKKINYPCQTAAIFQDVIYVMRPASASELLAKADKASEFYLNYFPFATLEDIREGILYSFGGLYLNDFQLIREAA
ncbi:TPA: hypothetical protein ACNHAG_005184 [Klebsiella pneumoniae]|uniref:hypothetical protein n=1 Tax=Klebsiella pneumoniae TaxID=573 RepID=UPI001C638A09|nr:hypothetical protein [Klebsiella pneumoniae]EKV3456136.1 hypothetical protein [Klebsiella pneumoniae]EKV5224539.1 hypothetical protein [Klebsiella pneumoniae]EKW9503794.1 hypothetical protein [Klebsiella pneumoniae]EKZ5597441.1 hypothetical protein [Klebsiella pneumoniae]ELY5902346.1 hypothetical protein [Klebsiella pneumoniae]